MLDFYDGLTHILRIRQRGLLQGGSCIAVPTVSVFPAASAGGGKETVRPSQKLLTP